MERTEQTETIYRDVPCGGLTERVTIHLVNGEVRGWSLPPNADTATANMLRRYCKGFADGVQYCRETAQGSTNPQGDDPYRTIEAVRARWEVER